MIRGVTRVEKCVRPGGEPAPEYRTHFECEVLYILVGKMSVSVRGRSVELVTGSMLFINGQVEHREDAQTEEGCEYFVLCFNPQLTAQWQSIVPDVNFARLMNRSHMLLEPGLMDQNFVREMIKTLMTAYEHKMRGIFNLKLIELVSYLTMKTKLVKREPYDRHKSVKERHYEEIIRFVEENGYCVGLEEISRRFFMNRYYICHIFREIGGTTLSEHIHAKRIDMAAGLLKNTDEPITSVAQKCGYDTAGGFGRAFGSRVGMSPREYRKRHRNLSDAGRTGAVDS